MPARKSLLDLLKEEDFSADKNQKNLAEFIAEKKEIQEALDAYWAVRNIWKVLTKAGRITMPYSTFCRLVKTQLKTPKEEAKNEPKSLLPSKRDGFTHNATPNPKDLI
jgi:hypothetical protein